MKNPLKTWKYLFALLFLLLLLPATVQAKTYRYQVKGIKSGQDITKTLQKYLDKAKDSKSGNKYEITVPKGTYKLTSRLCIYSNTTLKSRGVTYVRAKNGILMISPGSKKDKGFMKYKGYHDIAIIGGTWDGNSVTLPIFRGSHLKNLIIKDCTFKRCKDNHMVTFGGCKGITIDHCTFRDFVGKAAGSCEALQFDIMKAAVFPNQPEYDDTPCVDVTVRNCTFKNLKAAGMGSHSTIAGSYFNNFKILNNTFSNIYSYAIITSNYTNCTIKGNKISDCGSGIIIRAYARTIKSFFPPLSGIVNVIKKQNIEISNNTIRLKYSGYKSMPTAIKLYGEKTTEANAFGAPAGDYRVGGVHILNNNITFTLKGIAVGIEGADDCEISGNNVVVSVTDAATKTGPGDAIRLTNCTGCTLSGNTLTSTLNNKLSAGQSGILLKESTDIVVEKNTVTGFYSDGIRANNSSTAVITENDVKNCKRYGILVSDKSEATLSGNKVSQSGKQDIRTMGGGVIHEK